MTLSIQRISRSADQPLPDFQRNALPDPSVLPLATAIVADVAKRGDAALTEQSARVGGGLADGAITVDRAAMEQALDQIPPAVADALRAAIANVTAVHEKQIPENDSTSPRQGVTVDRVWTPLDSVGVYVPGGRALYPSSLIMGVIPAKLAGVGRIVVATPARPDGAVDPVVLAAAALLDVDALYGMGGAQAIGALAYGTESVVKVDKIVGPGGPWITAAKLAVYGACGVDLPAGPSESAVVVDASADPAIVAADVMCQAEHGEESAVALISVGEGTAERVLAELEATLPSLERAETIQSALEDFGMVVTTTTVEDAAAVANEWAPEHLSIHTEDASQVAASIPNAGSVFVGHWTPESAGDYATGANHVLPTGGLARAYGPLATEDFGSWRQIQTLTEEGLRGLAPTITTLANTEGLTAHAYAVDIRLGDQ